MVGVKVCPAFVKLEPGGRQSPCIADCAILLLRIFLHNEQYYLLKGTQVVKRERFQDKVQCCVIYALKFVY